MTGGGYFKQQALTTASLCFGFTQTTTCAVFVFFLGLGSAIALAKDQANTVSAKSSSAKDPFRGAATTDCFAQVWLIAGEVTASREMKSRALKSGDSVFVGETIRATPTSEAVLQTADAGLVAVRPGAEFVTESFAAEARNTDHFRMRISRGALRLISGWISGINREGVQIFTPEARIGIHGTDHEPYVLPEDLADSTPFEVGSYDKVNRGRTLLATTAGELELRAGQVGFAPSPELTATATATSKEKSTETHRGLMTLLLPTLMGKIPNFYIAGKFEQDIDSYSQTADAYAKARLDERQAGNKPVDKLACAPVTNSEVDYSSVARNWISRLDADLLSHDAQGIVDLFDRDAVIEAMVLESGGGIVTSHLDRVRFVNSVGAATSQLSNYHQSRDTFDAQAETPAADGPQRVRIRSHVIEQGQMGASDYRMESDEDYLLEYREGRWLAVRAVTVQR